MKTNWLRNRRIELDLTQSEVAARLQIEGFDISRGSISNWENDRFNAPLHDPEFRRVLAKILRWDVRTLLHASGYEVQVDRYSERALRAAYIVDHLSAEQQQLALNILEQFLEKA